MTPADLHRFADRLENLYALGVAEAAGIAAIRAIANARLDTGWATPDVTAGDVRAAGLVYDPELGHGQYPAPEHFVPRPRDRGMIRNDIVERYANTLCSLNDTPLQTGSFRANIAHQLMHQAHQQNDEMACRCGKRWPVGEEHP